MKHSGLVCFPCFVSERVWSDVVQMSALAPILPSWFLSLSHVSFTHSPLHTHDEQVVIAHQPPPAAGRPSSKGKGRGGKKGQQPQGKEEGVLLRMEEVGWVHAKVRLL